MYIKYKDSDYPCKCRIESYSITYTGLPEDFPAPVEGEVALYDNEGNSMRVDKVEDYLRQTFTDGVLTLTNLPELTPPTPADSEPTDTEVLNALLGV